MSGITTDGVQLTANGDKQSMSLGNNWGTIYVSNNEISMRRKAGGGHVRFNNIYLFKQSTNFNFSNKIRVLK